MTGELSVGTAGDLRALRRSPLHHLADVLAATGSEETVRLTELPFRTQIEIRADARRPVAERLADVLGVPLPVRAGQVASAGQRQVLWLGPDWWLIDDGVQDAGSGLEPRLVTTLRNAADGEASIADVSAHRTTLRLSGPYARAVLEHGCSLDLHPRAFSAGSCAQTHLAKVQVVLHKTATGATETYHVLVRASYADYVARWLLDAMTEYVSSE